MNRRQRIQHFLTGILSTVLGTFVIFATVIGMNKATQGLNRDAVQSRTSFQIVEKNTPEPQQKIVHQKQQPQQPETHEIHPVSPLLGMNAALAGIAFDLPAFQLSSLRSLQEGVLGKSKDQKVVMTGESVDVPPRPVYHAPIPYPTEAKSQGVEGYVLLSILISATGDVEQVKVLKAKPNGVFEKAAIRGVRDWRFRPAKNRGKQVSVWVKQKIRFELS